MGAMTGDADPRKGMRRREILAGVCRPFVLVTFGGGEPIEAPYCVRHVNLGVLPQDEVLRIFSSSDLFGFYS